MLSLQIENRCVDMLICLIVVIISQCIHISNYQVIYLKYIQLLIIRYILLKLEGKVTSLD
jgi:hypothetical protein